MLIEPQRNHRPKHIGLFVNSLHVIGDWGITESNRIPPDTALYAWSHRAVWEDIRAGKGRARFWRKRYVNYEVDGFRVYSLRDALAHLTPEAAFQALREWAEWAQGYGANLSSVTSTSWSLWRRTLPRRMLLASNALPMPRETLLIGGRQECQPGVYDEAESWDINGAYQSAMRDLLVGARYRHVTERPHIFRLSQWRDCVGFARAHVHLGRGKYGYGPLPAANESAAIVGYPTVGMVEGIYDLEELRAAAESGATIIVYEAWLARGLRLPWRKWSDCIDEGRKLPPDSARLVKTMANSLWGSFAVNGRGAWVSYPDGKPRVRYDERDTIAPCRTLSAHISAAIRARLYREAMAPLSAGAFCVSAHTDGAIFQTPCYPNGPHGGNVGQWRRRHEMENVVVLTPQAYKFRDKNTGETRFIVAGAPPAFAASIFKKILQRTETKRARNRLRPLLAFGAYAADA